MTALGKAARHAALALAGSLEICTATLAQNSVPPARTPAIARPDFGTKDRILYHVGYPEFTPEASSAGYTLGGTAGRFSPGILVAAPHIPSGALLTYLELDYCDTSGTELVGMVLRDQDYLGGLTNNLQLLNSNLGPSGCGAVSADLTGLNYTMDNNTRQLILAASSEDATAYLVGAYVGYKLQVQPAPGFPTFGDVPTSHLYFRAIEALAASGITGGCGGGNYCPGQSVTRGEMAAFLARALGLHFPN